MTSEMLQEKVQHPEVHHAADLRITDARLKFGFPIARTLGNCLSIRNLGRLAALIGHGRTREMLFTARLIEAEEALAVGLVSEVLDSPEAVAARATEEELRGLVDEQLNTAHRCELAALIWEIALPAQSVA